jgi:hypothetical protein
VKLSDEELAIVPLTHHDFHGDWNYTNARLALTWAIHERAGREPARSTKVPAGKGKLACRS